MALTKIPTELSSTPGISDSSTSTAITIDSSGNVTFSGAVTATAATQSAGDNSTKIATTAYADAAAAAVVDAAPSTLDTLNELAAALGDDANFSTTVTNSIAAKLSLAGGTMTGDIAHASNFTIDVGGELILDVDTQGSGNGILLKDAGVHYGSIFRSSSHLHIKAEAQDKNLLFLTNNGGSELTAMTIGSAGNVGIDGQSSPNADFHIGTASAVGDATNPALQFGGSTTYRLGMYTDAEGGYIENKNGDDGLIFRVKTAGEALRIEGGTGNVGIGAAPDTTGFGGTFKYLGVNGGSGYGVFNGQTSSTTASDAAASFFGSTTGSSGYKLIGGMQVINHASSASNAEGAVRFFTATGGSIYERMRIDNNGKVGIGTDSAVSPLTTSIGAGSAGSLNNQISMTHSGASNHYHIKTVRASANDEPAGLAFVENTTERMRISDDGKLIHQGKPGTSPIFEMINNDNEDNDTGRETSLRFSGHRSGGEDVVNAQISGHHDGSADDDKGMLFFYTNNGSGLNLAQKINNIGAITAPSQPAFSAEHASGGSLSFSINTATTVQFQTEIFDQGSDYNASTYQFTAPVSGKYQLNAHLRLNDVDESASYYVLYIKTSNRNYYHIIDPGAFDSDSGYWTMQVQTLADMDANDVAYVEILQSAGSNQTSYEPGSGGNGFSGYLVA